MTHCETQTHKNTDVKWLE